MQSEAIMRVVTAAAILVVVFLVGCAEGKRARGKQNMHNGDKYGSYATTKEPSNIAAALVGIYLPEFRPYGGCPTIMIELLTATRHIFVLKGP